MSGIDTAEDSSIAKTNPRRDILELAIGYGLILSVIWTQNPWQRVLYWLALAAILIITLLRRDRAKTLGLTGQGFVSSLWIVGVAALLAVIAMAVAWRLHTLRFHLEQVVFNFRFTGYAVWAFVQQFLLQDFFLLRLLRLVRNRGLAVTLAALLFALAHIPNPLLVTLTLAWGMIACVLFLRYRNLYTLGIAHAILGISVAVTVPNHIQRHMRVGIGYLHYHPRQTHFHPHRP